MVKTNSTSFVRISDDKVAQLFLRDVRRNSVLPPEEQKALVAKAQKGDLEARDKLILTNMGFIVSLAKHFGTNDNYNDLVNEGVFGMVKAIDKFDVTRDVRFISYAVYWIRMYMKDFVALHSGLVKQKDNVFVSKYVPKLKNEFMAKNGREPTVDELMDMFEEKHIRIPAPESLQQITMHSIDDSGKELDNGLSYSKILNEYEITTSSNNINVDIEKLDRDTIINMLLDEISDQDKEIVKWKFGFAGEPMSFFEIGSKLNMSESKVKRLFNKSMDKMGRLAEKITRQKYIQNGQS